MQTETVWSLDECKYIIHITFKNNLNIQGILYDSRNSTMLSKLWWESNQTRYLTAYDSQLCRLTHFSFISYMSSNHLPVMSSEFVFLRSSGERRSLSDCDELLTLRQQRIEMFQLLKQHGYIVRKYLSLCIGPPDTCIIAYILQAYACRNSTRLKPIYRHL